MASNTGVNVLRWSALGLGVFYGFYHQRTINQNERQAALDREYSRKEHLIAKARAEYAKKTMPKESKTASGDVISDPNDKNFDLEAYLKTVEVEAK